MRMTSNKQFIESMKGLGMEQLGYTQQSIHNFLSLSCMYDPSLCDLSLIEISEKNNTVNNLPRMSVIMGHFPGGAGVKNFEHFAQNMKTGKFCKFDYGSKKNQ